MSFVVDNSIAMTWCFDDEATDATDAVLERVLSSGAMAPALWPLEATNVLLACERRKRITAHKRKEQIAFLRALPITLDLHTHSACWDAITALASAYQLSVYDAAYLELAQRESVTLATLDTALVRAAKKAGVKLLRVN